MDFRILIIRMITGLVCAVILSNFFFQQKNIVSISALAIFLVGMAYVLEFFKNRNK